MKLRAYVSEFLGAFALVFVGVGAAVSAGFGATGNATLLGVALAHGLAIVAIATSLGPISGGHFNPAVTLGAWVGKRIALADALIYIIAQCIGAWVAIWLLMQSMPADLVREINFGVPEYFGKVDTVKALILEAVATFFLVFTVYGTAFYRKAPQVGALFVGLSIVMGILAIGPFTGAALNPARWFGPAMFAGGTSMDGAHMGVYIGGPIIGGLLAGILFAYFFEKEPEAMEGTGGPT